MHMTFSEITDRHIRQAVEFANANALEGAGTLIFEDEPNEYLADRLIIRTADQDGAGFRIAQWSRDHLGLGSRGDLRVSTFQDRRAAQRLTEALLHFA